MFRCLFFGVIALCAPVPSFAQGAPAPFTLPALPYATEALDPAIDATTMTIHHDKHHQAYVDALNKAVVADPSLAGRSLEALLAKASTLPPVVRNNAGGHWNHSFFWKTMAPAAQSGQPSAPLGAAIDRQFGSLAALKSPSGKPVRSGSARAGCGWW